MAFYKSTSEKCWLTLSILCGLSALAILLQVTFGMQTVESAFGQRWVSTEIILFHPLAGSILGVPATVDLVIQFKPITGFMAFSFLWFATAFQSLRTPLNWMMNQFPIIHGMINLAAFLLCLIAGYEVAWNFTAFGAVLASMPNTVAFNKIVDGATFQYASYPVNAVFATKMFTTALFIGIYTLYSNKQCIARTASYSRNRT